MSEPLFAVAIDLREIAGAIKSRCGGMPVLPEGVKFLNLIVEVENDLVKVKLSREDVAFMNGLLTGEKIR